MRNPLRAPTIRRALGEHPALPPTPDEEAFSYWRLANGTFKTTKRRRFAEIDPFLVEQLRSIPGPLNILDVATSSGTCAVELTHSLRAAGIAHTMYASDAVLDAKVVSCFPLRILLTDDGHLLQVDVSGLAFPNTPPSRLSSIVFAVARMLLRLGKTLPLRRKTVQLLSQEARASEVRFASGDVWGTPFGDGSDLRFDVIRVANLLNLSYFRADQIQTAVGNLAGYLKEGGLLFIVRTDDERNLASLYRQEGGQIRVVQHVNGGVEIAAILPQ